MPSQMDTAGSHAGLSESYSQLLAVAAFGVAIGLVNVAVNRLAELHRATLPASFRFEYAVSLPLTTLGAVTLLVVAFGLAVGSLAAFVVFLGGTDESKPNRPDADSRTVRRLLRAGVVLLGGTVAVLLGSLLLLVPGIVCLVYLPLVFVDVVRTGHTIPEAIRASRARIRERPLPVVATAVVAAACLVGVGALGAFTAFLTPTAEFAVGVLVSTLAVLGGVAMATGLHRRLPATRTRPRSSSGRL